MRFNLIAVLLFAVLVVVSCTEDNDPPENGQEGDAQELIVNGVQRDDAEEAEDPPTNGQGDEEEEEEEDESIPQEEEEEQEDESTPQELQDEVEQAKRARRLPQLGRHACLILKRYGLCKVHLISRMCVGYCRPPCKDGLSRRSCWLIRFRYKRCHLNIGRYCKRTCKRCPKPIVWKHKSPFWCGVKNRRLLISRKSFDDCKKRCLTIKGCRAVEWWGKYNFNCYQCFNPRKMTPYTNTKDLAYPPHVAWL